MIAFEWDEPKNEANIAKHGVSFAYAALIFEGKVLSWIDDRIDYGEIREISIGAIENVVILVVVHTERDGRLRIISARSASQKERARYETSL